MSFYVRVVYTHVKNAYYYYLGRAGNIHTACFARESEGKLPKTICKNSPGSSEKTYTLRDRLIPVERLRIHSHKLFFVVSRTFITSVIALYQKEVHGIAT